MNPTKYVIQHKYHKKFFAFRSEEGQNIYTDSGPELFNSIEDARKVIDELRAGNYLEVTEFVEQKEIAWSDVAKVSIMNKKDFNSLVKNKTGAHFRLIGNTTIFRAVHFAMMGGFIPSVTGHTLDNKLQTQPRIADIIWL